MPYEVEIDETTGVSRVTLSGEVDIELLTSALVALRDLPDHRWRTLMIYETSAEILMTGEDMRTLARFVSKERRLDAPTGRTAVVASEDLIFGLSRMYEVFAQELPIDFRVFRDLADAIEWLREAPVPPVGQAGPADRRST